MLKTKFNKPRITPDLIVREQLLNRLNAHKFLPFTLVIAPAGYGKSMIVSQWLESANEKNVWISLDNDHNDLRTFLKYFTEAILQLFPDSLKKLHTIINSSELPSVNSICEELINALDILEENYILVLDDYHMIHNEKIHKLISCLVKYPPENQHLVIISRTEPQFNFNELRLYGRINELGLRDLAFTKEELIEVIKSDKKNKISEEVLIEMIKLTEGWILGLKMMLFSQFDRDSQMKLSMRSIKNENVTDFLIENSISILNDDLRNVLLLCSLLEKFNDKAIEHLLKIDGQKVPFTGKYFISELVRRNMFVIALDAENNWYRFHHLFRDLLKNKFERQTDRKRINELYTGISDWFEKQSFIYSAINYAIHGKDYDLAGEIISRHRHEKLNEDKWWIVKKWLKRIPAEIIHGDSELLSAQLFAYADSHRFREMVPLIQLLEYKLKLDPDPIIQREFYFHTGFIGLWLECDAPKALKNLKTSRSILGKNDIISRRLAFYEAVALQMDGRSEEALKGLRKLVDQKNSVYVTLDHAVIIVFLLSGNINSSISQGQYFRILMNQANNVHLEAWANYLYGNAVFQNFGATEAEKAFGNALSLNPVFNYRLAVDAAIGRVLSFFMTNEVKAGLDALEEYKHIYDETQLLKFIQSGEARIQLILGNFEAAGQWAQTQSKEFHISDFHIFIDVPIITMARICILSEDLIKIKFCLADLKIIQERTLKINNRYHLVDLLILQSIGHYKLNEFNKAQKFLEEALAFAELNGIMRPFIESGVQLKNMITELYTEVPNHAFVNRIIQFIDHSIKHLSAYKSNISLEHDNISQFNLTKREVEILNCVAKGLRNKEIADELHISLDTVKTHVKSCLRKTHANNRVQLIRMTMTHKIINP